MSLSTCVKCDYDACSSQLHHDPMTRPHEWHLPDEWMTLIAGDTQLNQAWHFCSYLCLFQWISLHEKIKQDVTDSIEGNALLSTSQIGNVNDLRRRIARDIAEQVEAFHGQYPELRIRWDVTIDAVLREVSR